MEDVMRKPRLSAIAAALLLSTILSAGEKKPVGNFKETSWDFGKIKQGEVLTHEFVFSNDGQAPLVIERVATSCGCTAALVSEDKIGPGKTGRIKVTFDSRGYSGKVIKYVYVESNDSADPRREMVVSAEIEVPPQPRIELDRYSLDLGLSLEGEETSGRVLIRNVGELELKVEASHPEFRFYVGGKPAAFPLLMAAGKSAEVEIRFPGGTKTGMLRDYVLFKSNDPVRSTLSIYVSRYIITKAELKSLFNKYKKVLDNKD
jgi:hypothetical protein